MFGWMIKTVVFLLMLIGLLVVIGLVINASHPYTEVLTPIKQFILKS